MSLHERTLSVVGRFYDAALNETLWPSALKSLAGLTRSQAASFWVLDASENPHLPTFLCINFDPKSIQEYLNGMASLDPTVRYLLAHPQRAIVHDGLIKDDRSNDSRGYYDWHERNVETRFRMVGQAPLAPLVQAGVALHRTEKAGPFEPPDIEGFSVLHEHLQRALAIGFRIGSLGAMRQFGAEWLDRESPAVVLLDERKRVVFVNLSAQSIQSNGDGIRLTATGIALAQKRDDDKLQSLVAQAISSVASAAASTGGIMRAPRPSGKRPYGISVVSFSRQYPALSLFRPAVFIVITDPDRQPLLPKQRLCAAFGLTEAEARLAELLTAGDDLRHVAEKLNITYGSARTRLAQIFQKTETSRQGELISLLLATIASV